MWWYLLVLAGSFVMAMATIYTAKSGLPWYVSARSTLITSYSLNLRILQVGFDC